MPRTLKTPDEMVPFRTLAQILAAKPGGVFSVSPAHTAREALGVMAEKRVGFLVVFEGEKFAGVLSERDYLRKLVIKTAAVFVVIGVYYATGIV